MTPEETRALYEACWDAWGSNLQTDILLEEMAELMQAILKSRRHDGMVNLKAPGVAEELADVLICTEQLMLMMEKITIGENSRTSMAAYVKAARTDKLNRLQKRLTDWRAEREKKC